MKPSNILATAALISLTAVAGGCSGGPQGKSPIPSDGKSIEQIYVQHEPNSETGIQSVGFVPSGGTHLRGYSRDVNNELSALFPQLPNPTIIMYVFPHLSIDGAPVPGYSTMFQLYEKVEYALPGEVLVR